MAVLLTADCNDEKYLDDQMEHFFSTVSYELIYPWSESDKQRLFKMLHDHEALICKLLGDGYKRSLFNLPESARNGLDNEMTNQYKKWLEKQQ